MDIETIASFKELLKRQDDRALRDMLAAGHIRKTELDAMVAAVLDELRRRGRRALD